MGDVLRLARSAFLETQTSQGDVLISPMTIHVLNYVLFPNTNIREVDTRQYVGLPIFGADIVSLPGNKHLVAVDFQPVLPFEEGATSSLLPERYSEMESKLKSIHDSYQLGTDAILPWGGDIPPQATRFFSPYALWTRLSDDDAIDKVETVVWNAFQDYLDLYMEIIKEVQRDVSAGRYVIEEAAVVGNDNPVMQGQMDYLEYRRANDPARPMLQRLYGEDWTERVIAQVLFPDI
jgi:phycoerythrobilin:ferredoxin oxidoreductase